MKLWMPIDTLVFYWNERTSTGAHVYPTPLEEVIADLDHLCNENDGWTFLRRDMNNYQRTYQYKSQEAGQDVRIDIQVQMWPLPGFPNSPTVKMWIQCGNLGLTANEVYKYLQMIARDRVDRVQVAEYHAKYDDTEHSKDWVLERIQRGYYRDRADHPFEGTSYFGDQGTALLRVYDKVADATAKNKTPWKDLTLCTRIEKVVKLQPDKRYGWQDFLSIGAERTNPFRFIKLGNIEALENIDKRKRGYRLVKQYGVHEAIKRLREDGHRKDLDELKALLFTNPPIDLEQVWLERVREWAKL